MNLFHGSNGEVKKPILRSSLRALDFGAGFYLTSGESQAVRWAKTVTKRRRTGSATLNVYTFSEENLHKLSVLRFKSADAGWLDFVVKNRKEQAIINAYDLIIGPVANDATLPVINDYMDGVYTQEEAVRRLVPQNLTDQYAFLTDNALAMLFFEGSRIV